MNLLIGILAFFLLSAIAFAIELHRAIPLEDDEPQNEKNMAMTDFTYCKGIHCPNRNQCKRYVDGLEAAKEHDKLHSWIQNCRHAKLFIHKDGNDT